MSSPAAPNAPAAPSALRNESLYVQEVAQIIAKLPDRLAAIDAGVVMPVAPDAPEGAPSIRALRRAEASAALDVQAQTDPLGATLALRPGGGYRRLGGDSGQQSLWFQAIAAALMQAALVNGSNPAWLDAAARRRAYADIISNALPDGIDIAPSDPLIMGAVKDDPYKALAQNETFRMAPSILMLCKRYVASVKIVDGTPKYSAGEVESKAAELAHRITNDLYDSIKSAASYDIDTPAKRATMYENVIYNVLADYEPMAALPGPSAIPGQYGLSMYGGQGDARQGGQATYALRNQIRGIVNGAVMGSGQPMFAPGQAMVMQPGTVTYGPDQRYLPTMPQISSVHRSTQPCMFEHQIQKGPGFMKWKCTRAGRPGVKKCSLVRVEKDQSRLVPINCTQESVNVVKGYDVQKTTTTLPSGQQITRQFVTPEVAVYGNVRKLGPAGPGIPVRMSEEQKMNLDAQRQAAYPFGNLVSQGETVMFGGRGGAGAQRAPNGQAQRMAGASMRSRASAAVAGAQSGGVVRLPSRSMARAKEVEFGPDDIQNFELGTLPGVIKEPQAWADLPAPGPNEISFYTHDDSYGTTNNRHRSFGYTFSFRHLPYAYMTQQEYLEWLVSLSYRLRHEWSQFHSHVYDPLKDTIATVESYILTTLGRLEAADKWFDRRAMFAGAGQFRNVMHPILAAYAFRPPQRTWFSPLSARYLDDATGSEQAAVDNVEVMARATVALMKSQLKIDESITLNYKDAQVMAIMEDTLLALLARLQFLNGYVVNTFFQGPVEILGFYDSEGNAITRSVNMTDIVKNGLLSIGQEGQRRFLTKELARYLEMFQLDDEADKPLHYLPALRLRQAREQGLVVPTINMPATGMLSTALPIGMPVMPKALPDEYQTIVTQPNANVILPAYASYGNYGNYGYNLVSAAAAGGRARRPTATAAPKRR